MACADLARFSLDRISENKRRKSAGPRNFGRGLDRLARRRDDVNLIAGQSTVAGLGRLFRGAAYEFYGSTRFGNAISLKYLPRLREG